MMRRSLVFSAAFIFVAVVSNVARADWTFYSQRDANWKGDTLGTCNGDTIGTQGCAMTAMSMGLRHSGANVDPRGLNNWLRNQSGYSQGCLIIWSAAANYPGSGLVWGGTGTLSSASALKNALDTNKLVIAMSKRFASHFGVIRGYDGSGGNWSDFYYWDPWDTSPIDRRVGDGWVQAGNSTRLFTVNANNGSAPAPRWSPEPRPEWRYYRSDERLGFVVGGTLPNTVKPHISTLDNRIVDQSTWSNMADGYMNLSYAHSNGMFIYYVHAENASGTGDLMRFMGWDTTNPYIVVESGIPERKWWRIDPNVVFRCKDDHSGPRQSRVSLDSGVTWSGFSVENPHKVTFANSGKYKVVAGVMDDAWKGDNHDGNYGEIPIGEYWVDTTPPTVARLGGASPEVWYSAAMSVQVAASDADSGPRRFEWKWDNGAVTSVAAANGSVNLMQGQHTLWVRSYDNAQGGEGNPGNDSGWVNIGTYWLDTSGAKHPAFRLTCAITSAGQSTQIEVRVNNNSQSVAKGAIISKLQLGTALPAGVPWAIGNMNPGAIATKSFTFPMSMTGRKVAIVTANLKLDTQTYHLRFKLRQ
jgi:hypothetical protein